MSIASIGYLANITSSATLGGTYTALVTEPTMVTIPTVEVSKVDATHLQSPGRTKEYIPGMYDPSAASYEANFVKADYLTLQGFVGQVRYFKVSSPDPDGAGALTGMTCTFPGYVHKIETDAQSEDLIKMKWEIQTTGAPTYA
jgi:hypothetical protein